jgi:pyrimidine operon attenuation protein/uracil phosphoribosyltransferase
MTFEESLEAISKIPQQIIETNKLRDKFVVKGVKTV